MKLKNLVIPAGVVVGLMLLAKKKQDAPTYPIPPGGTEPDDNGGVYVPPPTDSSGDFGAMYFPSDLDISQAGEALIKQFENKRYKAEYDYKGYSTGYGHLIKSGEEWMRTATLTDAQIEQIFDNDLIWVIAAIDNNVKVPITQNMFDALSSFIWNFGEPAFRTSTLLKKLNQEDYYGAANEFGKWINAGNPPTPVNGLINRRAKERALFLTPDY